MSLNSPLSLAVQIYRCCRLPALKECCFQKTTEISVSTSTLPSLVKELYQLDDRYFRELLIDGDEILSSSEINDYASTIELDISIPTGSENRFYNDLQDLIDSSSTICKGSLPPEFYISKINYYSKDTESPQSIRTLSSICEVIGLLSEIAHYHDQKSSSNNHKLVFINSNEASKTSSIVLETAFTSDLLDIEELELNILKDLVKDSYTDDPHIVAKKGVFWSSLVEFSSLIPDKGQFFSYLLKNWKTFLTLYQNNFETYLSGFAFHKSKREVAEAELQLASDFSKVISEITGKLLTIPISLAAVPIIARSDNTFEHIIICLGLLFSTLLIVGVVDNQQRQLKRISHAKSIVLDSFDGKKESYPKELKADLANMTTNLNKNEKSSERLLGFVRCLAWVPVTLATWLVLTIS